MNLYMKKPEYVSAVKFVYSEAGIAEMTEFCLDVIDYQKERHMGAIGKATLIIEGPPRLKLDFEEGDYVVKHGHGGYNILKPAIFNYIYTIV